MPKKTTKAPIPEQPNDRTPIQNRLALKKKVRMFYDLQRLRIQCGGRVKPRAEGTEIVLHEVDIAVLERRQDDLARAEKDALADVAAHLKTMPFYQKVLSDKERYRGIGPAMAGVILSEFDIYREDTPSKMWAFAGLRPMPAIRCKKCHDVVVTSSNAPPKHLTADSNKRCGAVDMANTYESGKAQRPVKGEKLPYNAWLRTKLVGVLGGVLLKVGSPWRKCYDDYKHRKTTAGWGKSDGHRHQAAIRYMVKMLLQDIWREWRTLEGLPVRDPYPVEKQGKPMHSSPFGEPQPPSTEVLSDEIEAELGTLSMDAS